MPIQSANNIELLDEGVSQGRVRAINCTGAGVTATVTGSTATINIAGGGSVGGAIGTATLNFGTAASKTLHVKTVITGQTGIVAGSKVEAYLMGDATADHTDEEHIMAKSMMDLACGIIVPGVGFTIYANVRDELSKAGLTGQFIIQWKWS